MLRNLSIIGGGMALGLGIALAGYFISQTTLNERIGANTAQVKGLSERIVPADTGSWSFSYESIGRDFSNVATTFAIVENNAQSIREVLVNAGFSADEISFDPLRKTDFADRDDSGQIIDRYYSVSGFVRVSTKDPAKIGSARQPMFLLAKEGIDIRESSLDYEFTQLNDIKPDMLREATNNARIAANEFASNAGVKVGGIQSASQGGFQIRSINNSNSDLDKLVRVVTNITFYLDN